MGLTHSIARAIQAAKYDEMAVRVLVASEHVGVFLLWTFFFGTAWRRGKPARVWRAEVQQVVRHVMGDLLGRYIFHQRHTLKYRVFLCSSLNMEEGDFNRLCFTATSSFFRMTAIGKTGISLPMVEKTR